MLVFDEIGCFDYPIGTAVSLTGTVVAHETHPSLDLLAAEGQMPPGLIPACHILLIQALLRLKQHRQVMNLHPHSGSAVRLLPLSYDAMLVN